MLERLLLKHLTKKGKIAYFIGLVLSFAIAAYCVLGIAGYTLETGRDIFFFTILTINILWAGICYLIWKKKKSRVSKLPH